MEREYEGRLKERMEGVEEEMVVKEEEWRREVVRRMEEELVKEY